MTKSTKKTATRKPKLLVDVKINILHTIADAIYSTPEGKIREAVANSRDRSATWVVIALDQTNRRLSIFDNGSGITRQRFTEIFDNIGYGCADNLNGPTLSYFGLGLMSVFQLGNSVKIYTRPQGTRKVLFLPVQTGSIFDKANKGKSIRDMSNFMGPVQDAKESDRKKASLDILTSMFSTDAPVSMPESFTEIIIEDIRLDVIEEMSSSEFRETLSQMLPLRARDDEPFLKRFTGPKGREVAKLISNPAYCKTIDVYFGVQEQVGTQEETSEEDEISLSDDEGIPQLWKYFPKFKSSISFPDDNVYVGTCDEGRFGYYVVHSIGEDLQSKDGESDSIPESCDIFVASFKNIRTSCMQDCYWQKHVGKFHKVKLNAKINSMREIRRGNS